MKTVNLLRENLVGMDEVQGHKDGSITVRRGFFYRHGKTAEQFAAEVLGQIHALGIEAVLIEQGEVWKNFRGSASVRAQSHWYARFAVGNQ